LKKSESTVNMRKEWDKYAKTEINKIVKYEKKIKMMKEKLLNMIKSYQSKGKDKDTVKLVKELNDLLELLGETKKSLKKALF